MTLLNKVNVYTRKYCQVTKHTCHLVKNQPDITRCIKTFSECLKYVETVRKNRIDRHFNDVNMTFTSTNEMC